MRLTGAQAEVINDFADGDEVSIHAIPDTDAVSAHRTDNTERQSIVIAADGTILASSSFDWKKVFGKNLTLTT